MSAKTTIQVVLTLLIIVVGGLIGLFAGVLVKYALQPYWLLQQPEFATIPAPITLLDVADGEEECIVGLGHPNGALQRAVFSKRPTVGLGLQPIDNDVCHELRGTLDQYIYWTALAALRQ